jgi:molybdate transport system substrate-binding protein
MLQPSVRIIAVLRALATVFLVLLPGIIQAQDLTVFAAASLKEALDEVGQEFQRVNGHRSAIAYAASSALAKQIENGAPADVFISADLDWMDYLAKRQMINIATRTNLLRNRLVLIAPSDSRLTARIAPGFPLAKMLGGERLAVADPDSVPAGKYARAALEKLGVWASVEPRLARGDNVRAALNFVARGETPLGIVYQTDAIAEKRVKLVAQFPADTHPPIVYPVALTVGPRHAAASAFLVFLKSKAARGIFEKHGFGVEP